MGAKIGFMDYKNLYIIEDQIIELINDRFEPIGNEDISIFTRIVLSCKDKALKLTNYLSNKEIENLLQLYLSGQEVEYRLPQNPYAKNKILDASNSYIQSKFEPNLENVSIAKNLILEIYNENKPK